MADSFGPGVSRTLSALQRQFQVVVRQAGKPPLDAEENLQASIHNEQFRTLIQAHMPSGFLLDPVDSLRDYVTVSSWSNFFLLGREEANDSEARVWAAVNGWIVPVAGTVKSNSVANMVRLNPPPDTDSRIDFVFLEVWKAQISPNPATTNKPSASEIWTYGNVEYGGTNLADDLEDPTIGFETSERIQLQYRLRVQGQGAGGGTGVALDAYPDGLDDPNVFGQGADTTPVSGMNFTNMRTALGDAGLWRAGDGDPDNAMGTTDGYVYAIPVCAVFRRNSNPFVAVSISGGNPNQNGAYDRNRGADSLTDPRDGAKNFATPTLDVDLDHTTTGVIDINDLVSSALDDTEFKTDLTVETQFIVFGTAPHEEVVEISAVDTTGSPSTITIDSRGRGDTTGRFWPAGTSFVIYNSRPDGIYSDEIHDRDILDLRRGVTMGEWDYHRLLTHNLDSVFRNTLTSSYKQNGAGGDTEGPVVTEVDYLWSDGNESSQPNHTELIDGPDGVRTTFSDAAVLQNEISTLLDNAAPLTGGFTATTFNDGVAWDTDPGFQPSGWLNDGTGWTNGTILFMHVGGANGSEGARGSFKNAEEGSVRFMGPREHWLTDFPTTTTGAQRPVTLRFLDQPATFVGSSEDTTGETRPGALYPRATANFEKPFVVLGGILRDEFLVTGVDTTADITNLTGAYAEIDLSIDFDVADTYYPTGDVQSLDIAGVTNPLLNGTRTLYDMLTAGGRDETGESSELYLVVYGDVGTPENNGAFKIVGAGTVGYTFRNGTSATRIVVRGLSEGFSGFTATANSVVTQMRSQFTTSQDGLGLASGRAAMAVIITDIENTDGGAGNPWNVANTGTAVLPAVVGSKAVISTSIQYGPSRGGFARVPRNILQASVRTTGVNFLRQAVSVLDSDFAARGPFPTSEIPYDAAHVQLWNRLGDSGMQRADQYAENKREHELFVDHGSRTVVFRPMQDKAMTVRDLAVLSGADSLIGSATYPAGSPSSGVIKDGAEIFTSGPTMQRGIPVPVEHMPRFGRQDIPFHLNQGVSDPWLDGINHLFTDTTDTTNEVFSIIGGEAVTAGPAVEPLLFQTGVSSGAPYGDHSTITNPFHPAYQARLIEVPSEISQDTGRTMRGIQLPPHLGIARLYGVFERVDYIAKTTGTSVPGGFDADRVTLKGDPPTNLLRQDAQHNTLFILKDGAQDVTDSTGDHTYVVPDNAIDIRKIPTFGASGNTNFEDFEYVVECVVFGFPRDWINENNYVITRRVDQNVLAVPGGAELLPNMTLPSAAPDGLALYMAYDRVVYQGDPYMTRDGNTRQTADYQHRYGQVSQSDAYELNFPIQQYDENGDMVVERINPRGMEVLASVDFVTTLGTGKIGGTSFDGSVTDPGYLLGSDRIPADPTDLPWETASRGFSSHIGKSRATIQLLVSEAGEFDRNADNASDVELLFTKPDGTKVTILTTADPLDTAEAAAQSVAGDILQEALLQDTVFAYATGTLVTIVARHPGVEGNLIKVQIAFDDRSPGVELALLVLDPVNPMSLGTTLGGFLKGGMDTPSVAGTGNSNVRLAGLSERLPLGILVQDSDFLAENPSREGATSLWVHASGTHSTLSGMPLAGETSFTELFEGGEHLLMVDGAVKQYAAFHATDKPTGTKKYRTYRGGAVATLTGDLPCGPVRWNAGAFAPGLEPVLKGGVIVGKALLVKNYEEEAFVTGTAGRTRSYGDEIQMIILTHTVYGSPDCVRDGLNLVGEISPAGYGDGYASSDRYRLEGKPMEKTRSGNDFDLTKELVPYRVSTDIRVDDICP